MQRAIKWLVVVMLAATGVNGLVWLVGLLATQGLDRAEKILSVVAVPTTIAIGGIGLWLAWPGRRSGPAARPTGAQPGGGPDHGAHGAPRYWTAFALMVSFALNAVLFYVYLPSRLPELGYEIRVGVSGLHPGWSKSNDGESIESSTGFDMELVDFLKSRFDGNKWTVVKVDPVEREKSIVTGAVDLVVSNYSMEGTAVAYGALGLQRREMVDFSGPYFLDTSGIMRNPAKISAETKVPTEKLCVAKGTTAEDYIKETDASRKKGAQYRQQQECFERLLNPADATVVATVTDKMILKGIAASSDNPGMVLPQPDRDGSVRIEKYGIGLPNGHPRLCAALNVAIGEFISSNTEELTWDKAWKRHLSELDEQADKHRPPRPPRQCPDNA